MESRGDFMGLFDFLKSKEFEELFEKTLEKELTKPEDKNAIYSEITNYYLMLLRFLNINNFSVFHFIDYEDCHRVIVDEKEYDFDNLFNHDNLDATNALCAIDCLISDLGEDSLPNLLKKIEKEVNIQGSTKK